MAVNRTEPSPSVSIPWLSPYTDSHTYNQIHGCWIAQFITTRPINNQRLVGTVRANLLLKNNLQKQQTQ
jgi:hypothetical protein